MSGPDAPSADRTTAARAPADGGDLRDDALALPGPLGALDRAVARLEAALLAAGVLLMALNTVANVVGRYAFGQSLYFSAELNSALIVLVTFAGLSYAARHGRHVRMSAIHDALPARARKALMVLVSLVTAAFMLGLAWYSLGYVLTLRASGRVLPALSIPAWLPLVWVPLGFLLTGLQYALTAVKNLVEPGVHLSTTVPDGYAETPEEAPEAAPGEIRREAR